MNIALIGFRGTGKTTVAKLLSKKLDKKLISTDEEVIKRIKISMQKFVQKYSWEKFLEIESEIIENISNFDEFIFDTGDEIVIRNENVVNLKKNSFIILLTADINTLKNRIKDSKKRPSLPKISYIDEAANVLKERELRYKRAADYTIDTSMLPPHEICDLIIHYIEMETQ